ncbi:MAG: T9SS type A sorting domain-containing protein [Chitinophagaceae bacterium]|nr:MAG: T9SS type A sorting domain-containing protein [Chitinophagaceae bacterium]
MSPTCFQFLRPALFTCGFFFLLGVFAIGQNYSLTAYRNARLAPGSNGFYESLPAGYNSSDKHYPLLLVIHGAGQMGNGTSELDYVISLGVGQRLRDRTLPDAFTARDEVSYNFIVIIPQLISEDNGATVVNSIIDSCLRRYRVLTSKIYVTGTSVGGAVTWNTVGSGHNYASRIAAVVPMAGNNAYNEEYAGVIAQGQVPVWAFHNSGDVMVPAYRTNFWVNGINEQGANPQARKTLFPVNDHDCWTQATDPAYRENGMNMYEWMLGYSRDMDVLPVKLSWFEASTEKLNNRIKVNLSWQTAVETDNSHFIIERSADGLNYTSIGQVASQYGTEGGAYHLSDLSPGSGINYYRLLQVDADGSVTVLGTRSLDTGLNRNTPSLSIYPNPVTDAITFLLDNEQQGRMFTRIVNAGGAVISTRYFDKATRVHRSTLQTAALQPGFYVLEVGNEEGVTRLPFVRK